MASITERVKQLESTASQHRLNHRPQNQSLKSAEKIKERVAALKKQTKGDKVDVSVQLWIYPRKQGAVAKKVLIFFSNDDHGHS